MAHLIDSKSLDSVAKNQEQLGINDRGTTRTSNK